MAKLKNIIKQLSEKDYRILYDSMLNGNAEKSAYLLKALRGKYLSDAKIMVELGVNENAFYTLRSRLHLRIEEFLYERMEGARTETLRKVANVNETLFTQKKTISIATLKKLEKELLDYDMSTELTIIYKSLKRLNINTTEYYQYSQLYNRHVAYMLAVDKAEDMLADYFKKYGLYYLSGIESSRIELDMLVREMQNVAKLYQSHRLYVYQSCMLIWHRLFVEREESIDPESESVEDILDNVQKIFETYQLDSIYYHLNLVFEFLRYEYYNHYEVWKQSEKNYEEVNEGAQNLLMNYGNYTFPAQFLISNIKRHIRLDTKSKMLEEMDSMFIDYEVDEADMPKHIIITIYKAIALYYNKDYDQSAKVVNGILNDLIMKRFPYAMVELKSLLALLYVILEENELFKQVSNSVQRQTKLIGEDICENLIHFNKLLRIAISESKKDKSKKIIAIIKDIDWENTIYFSPVSMIKLDKDFVKLMSKR
jgi:hypothetical protein